MKFISFITRRFFVKNIVVAFLLTALSIHASATVITVEFDVSITGKFNYNTNQSEPFAPLTHQSVSMSFDSELSSVDRYWDASLYPINSHVTSNFGSAGSTSLSSPVAALTATNPIRNAPVTTSSGMFSQTWYSFAPHPYWEPQTVSYAHQVGASVTYRSSYQPGGPGTYAGESWSRTVGLYTPAEYLGVFTEADIRDYQFTSDDLIALLITMQKNGTAFNFADRFVYESRPTLLYSGYAYSGSAIITEIHGLQSNDVPEPAPWMLVGLGLLACWGMRRNQFIR